MTLELQMLALSIVLGLVQICTRLACCKPATRLCLDGEFSR
jgi:hypothetical protein